MSPVLALSGHHSPADPRLLSGVKRTCTASGRIQSARARKQRVSAIRSTSFLVRSFATPCADSACRWVNAARRLTGVAIGGTVSVLVPAATAILGTATIGRSVVAPSFQATTAVGPIGLR